MEKTIMQKLQETHIKEKNTSIKAPWITVEGVDGAGKSSHIEGIVEFLKKAGWDVVTTREPGGTDLGERLRKEILHTPMELETEVLLAFASRSEHLAQIIRPALLKNKAVVCDRFTDSTYAYQGFAQKYPLEKLNQLEEIVHSDRQPDLTLVFDLSPQESLKRLSTTGKVPDKFESQSMEFFQNVRNGYTYRYQNDKKRFQIIDSHPPLEEVKKSVHKVLSDFLKDWMWSQTHKNELKKIRLY